MTTTESYQNMLLEVYEGKGLSLGEHVLDDTFAISPNDARNFVSPTALKNMFVSEDWVYILVDRIASKIASQWIRVMREEVVDGKKVSKPAEGHPVQAQLEQPNEEQDYHSWMYNVVADDCLLGNCVIWGAKRTSNLICLPFDLTSIEQSSDGTIKSYIVSSGKDIGSKIVRFTPDEICHIRRPNPFSRIYGMSPFIPGHKVVAFNKYSQEYLNNFYVKGAQPGIIITADSHVNVEQAKRILSTLESTIYGRQNQRKAVLLPQGLQAQEWSHTLADQQLIEYVRNNRETIINLLQVPKHELSIAEAGSLGSEEYKIALKNFWNGPLRAIMRRIAGALTKFFADQLGPGLYLEFDLSDVDVLQEDADQKAQLADKLLSTHTLNEVRSSLYNLQPVPNGDTVRGASAALPNLFGQEQRPPLTTDQALSLIQDVEKGLMSRDAAAELLHTLHGLPTESVDRILPQAPIPSEVLETKEFNVTLLRKSVGSWFEESENQINRDTDNATPKMVKRSIDLFGEMAVKSVEVLLDYEKDFTDYETKALPPTKELRKRLSKALASLEDQYLSGLTDDLEALVDTGYDTSLAISFGKDDQDRLAAIRERNAKGRRLLLEERGLETFASVSASTTEQVMTLIEAGLEENLSIKQIAGKIRDRFTDETEMIGRAQTIARTETLTAISIGQAAALRDAEKVVGPMLKMWVNAGDERVRGNPGGKYPKSAADHWILQGEVVKSNELFPNGLMYPRDLRAKNPAEVINCRCRMVAVAAEDADAIGFGDLDRQHTGG